ncbi:ATP-binding protein [Massilia sp. TWR1-2-2]|uniref:ATP-binding protein n=1 Tax=Massilia sp. TWR1-2-2 TaxID=2804584 RepID=UPI003CEBF67C
MFDTETLTALVAPPGAAVVAPGAGEIVARLPPQPKTINDTGLELTLLVELAAKTMYAVGKVHLPVLMGKMRLSFSVLREVLGFMVAEQIVEVALRGDSDLDVHYQLTATGKLRAAEFLARCRYIGAAPVTLRAYRDLVLRQSQRQARVNRVGAAELAAAFCDDGIDASVRELIGAALQSGRSLMLHGPSGSGKSTIARKLGQLQCGLVATPYAILVDSDIVQFHDPLLHPAPLQLRQAEDRRSSDSRWALCQRPVVQVGADLSVEMLDLRHDKAGGVYHAPPHFLANNGMLVVDDLGRQRIAAAQLLNRWSGPLDSGTDQLTIEGGHKISVPFDVTLVLVTHRAPHEMLDASAMRRVGYKIHIGALGEAGYRGLFRRQCMLSGLECDERVLAHLIDVLHGTDGAPLLASYPRELIERIADFASFAGAAPRLTIGAIEQAWTSMLAGEGGASATRSIPHPAPYFVAAGDSLSETI